MSSLSRTTEGARTEAFPGQRALSFSACAPFPLGPGTFSNFMQVSAHLDLEPGSPTLGVWSSPSPSSPPLWDFPYSTHPQDALHISVCTVGLHTCLQALPPVFCALEQCLAHGGA